jgi:hypothetical protein
LPDYIICAKLSFEQALELKWNSGVVMLRHKRAINNNGEQ